MRGLDMPWVFQEVEAPRFQDSQHMKVVWLSSLRTGRLYPPPHQKIFLVPISSIDSILSCQLKEEALDRTMWRNRFGRGFGPVVWQITDDDDPFLLEAESIPRP